MIFTTALIFLIAQRLYEIQIAKRNTNLLLQKGGVEFGANHYWVIVLLHTLFFLGMTAEVLTQGIHPPEFWPALLIVFLLAQVLRVWIIRTMNGRWTTRILIVPKETLISQGPFRFIPHPNYTVVAIEILVFPLIFGLYYSSLVFTVLNAMVLLLIRIPAERKALNSLVS
jgi:methyltransferase